MLHIKQSPKSLVLVTKNLKNYNLVTISSTYCVFKNKHCQKLHSYDFNWIRFGNHPQIYSTSLFCVVCIGTFNTINYEDVMRQQS